MQLAIIIVFILYSLLLVWLTMGWRRAVHLSTNAYHASPFVSVIIPVRNEATTITSLLHDLAQQSYTNFEVVLVNDHSQDETVSVILSEGEKSSQLRERIKLHHCTIQSGKKAALTLGMAEAKGDIMLTTDADCRVEKGWIQEIVRHFTQPTVMVVGGVRFSATSFFERLLQLEFASLIGSGVATLGWNVPSMANGANLAFRKKTFEAVGGYAGNEQIPSGDDEFLLRKIQKKYPNSIRVALEHQSVVVTQPPGSLQEFMQQRIRWASKWSLHEGIFSKALALGVFVVQLVFLLLPWLMLGGVISWQIGLGLWLSKLLFEYLFFKPITRSLGIQFSGLVFLVLQFIYPYYVVAVGFAANGKKYTWKGRTF